MRIAWLFILGLLLFHDNLNGQARTTLSLVNESSYDSERPLNGFERGRGLSNSLQVELSAQRRWFRVSLNPRVYVTQNREIERFPVSDLSSAQLLEYRNRYSQIDLPEMYGDQSRTFLNWGNSELFLNAFGFGIGISHKPESWGSGQRQQLILSESAPGYLHAVLEARRMNLFLATVSLRAIGGFVDSSGYARYPMPDERRWLSGFSATLSPWFDDHLQIGLNRVFMQNGSELNSTSDYVPFLQSFIKNNLGSGTDGSGSSPDNQIASVFFQWDFPASGTKVYGEFGREDHNMDIRDAINEPDHNRAYLWGMELKTSNDMVIGVEALTLMQVNSKSTRSSDAWYVHTKVRHGHTHLGQVLGAEIGPGSRSQELWLRSHQTEISLRRVDVDRDLFNAAFSTGGYRPEVDWIIRARTEMGKGAWAASPEVSIRHTRNRFYIPQNHKTSVGVGLRLSWRFAPADQ